MEEERLIPVSPRHAVLLSREYLAFVDTAPQRDYVVRTVAKRQVGAMMLMSGDLVIASAETVTNCASSLPAWPRDRNVQCRFHQ